MTVLDQPIQQEAVNQTGMVHLGFVCDCPVAICGAPLQGIDAESEPLDCIICAELNEQQMAFMCPICGEISY